MPTQRKFIAEAVVDTQALNHTYQFATVLDHCPFVEPKPLPGYPDALFLVWRIPSNRPHFPHALLLDSHTAIMLTTQEQSLWYGHVKFRRGHGFEVSSPFTGRFEIAPSSVLVMTGKDVREVLNAVTTTMLLMYKGINDRI